MLTGGRAVIVVALQVCVIYMEPANPVIELPRQAHQSPRRHPEQRVNLVRSQVNSELETGLGRVPEEISPEAGIRQ
jgi:hypothetical protein